MHLIEFTWSVVLSYSLYKILKGHIHRNYFTRINEFSTKNIVIFKQITGRYQLGKSGIRFRVTGELSCPWIDLLEDGQRTRW